MKLQTQITIQKETKNPINYDSRIVLLGSCFSENIGNKFEFYKFQAIQNPFGIFFHPKAIANFITNTINKKQYSEKDIFFENERWHCFDAHSSLSSPNKETLLSNLNSGIVDTNEALKKASHLIITFGTAWVYRFLETNEIVANCHKIPQKKFQKELLSVTEISNIIEKITSLLQTINPALNIIFTVSPVRHLKDGFVENTQSKSHLIAGIHQAIEQSLSKISMKYFPSYEIMMDELRDYRFYEEDMIHPNQTAINYIWKIFINTCLTEDSVAIMNEIEAIQKGLLHKPFNEKSVQHQVFLENLAKKKEQLQQQFPFIKF